MLRRFPSLAVCNLGKISRKKQDTYNPSVTAHIGSQGCSNRDKATMPMTNRVCHLCVSQLRQCLTHLEQKTGLSDAGYFVRYPFLFTLQDSLHWALTSSNLCNCVLKQSPNASIWTSAKGKHNFSPPATMVQPRQVHARICSVAYGITNCCLFLMSSAPILCCM